MARWGCTFPRRHHHQNQPPSTAPFRPSPPKAWKAPSGHIVVQVQISGMDAPGYMLLDTGASGFVLQAGLAARYGLTQFGRLNIAGLTGKVRAAGGGRAPAGAETAY